MQQVIDFGTSEPTLAPILTGDKWDTVWQTLANDEDLNYVDASTGTSMANLITTGTNVIYKALTDGWTMSLAYSSGKDSECVLHLFLMALVRATRNGTNISQHHYVIHTDTGIENPAVRWLADTKLAELEAFVEKHQLPLSIVIGKPGLTSGWTGRILSGRGLPTFSNSSARQCSIDLKVDPARRARAEYMRGLPKAVRQRVCLLLGSRDAESTTRAMNIEKKAGALKTLNRQKRAVSSIRSVTGIRGTYGNSCYRPGMRLVLRYPVTCLTIMKLLSSTKRLRANVSGRVLKKQKAPVVHDLAVTFARL